ncbi:MAG: DNA glycosylase [Oscillospiraceae bacterium]
MEYLKNGDKIIFENVKNFSLNETFLCGQTFRWDEFCGGFRGFAGQYLCHICLEGEKLSITPHSPVENYDEFAGYMFHYLSLDMDYEALKKQFSQDEVMGQAIGYAQGIRVLNQEFFQTLITFIISQNNNIPRIKKIVDALSEKYGTKVGEVYAFPTAFQLKDVSIEDYNQLKVGFRSKYIFDAVDRVNKGEISKAQIDKMTYEQAQKYLLQIKGVGPKVADCVLLFSCEKYESFPKDVWINRALEQMFPKGLPQCIQGFEGIAQQYIFHYARFHLEK